MLNFRDLFCIFLCVRIIAIWLAVDSGNEAARFEDNEMANSHIKQSHTNATLTTICYALVLHDVYTHIYVTGLVSYICELKRNISLQPCVWYGFGITHMAIEMG